MFKKSISLILVFAVVFMMTACGASSVQLYDYDLSKYVKLGDYKGIEVEKVTPEAVTDDSVTAEIQATLEANQELKEVDTKVEDGDTVNTTFTGTIDGKVVDNCCSEDYDVIIGSGSQIEGFEDGLIGHKKGDKVTLNLTFPEDYGDEAVNGKDVVFEVTINSVSRSFVPDLTDEFVKEKSGTDCKTVAEYEKYIKKQLEQESKDAAQQEMQYACFQTIIDNTEIIGYPEKELESYKQKMLEYYEQYAAQYGTDLDGFLEMAGTDNETLQEQIQTQAEQVIAQQMIMLAICRAEGIEVSDSEYKEQVQAYADEYGFESVEAFEEEYTKEDILLSLYAEKFLDFILDNAKIVDKLETTADDTEGTDDAPEKADSKADAKKEDAE